MRKKIFWLEFNIFKTLRTQKCKSLENVEFKPSPCLENVKFKPNLLVLVSKTQSFSANESKGIVGWKEALIANHI